MPTVRIKKDTCKGCELCITFCPKKVLMMSDEYFSRKNSNPPDTSLDDLQLTEEINSKGYKYAVLVKESECIGCATCGRVCPEVAITVYK